MNDVDMYDTTCPYTNKMPCIGCGSFFTKCPHCTVEKEEAVDTEEERYKMSHDMLDKRWCDLFEDSTNTQTVREWIHDARKYLYGHDDISDEYLDGLSSVDLDELIEDLDYLLGK